MALGTMWALSPTRARRRGHARTADAPRPVSGRGVKRVLVVVGVVGGLARLFVFGLLRGAPTATSRRT
jgi:hypothetical protein